MNHIFRVFSDSVRFSFLLVFGHLIAVLTSCGTLTPESPDAIVAPVPAIEQPSSHLNIPLTIDLAPYLKEVEASVPKEFNGSEQLCEGVSYSYKVSRKPIVFSGSGNLIRYNVKAAYALNLNYCPGCTYLFNGDGNCIVPRVYASCGVGEAMRNMEISYSGQIGIAKNWRFSSRTTLQKVLPLDPCRVTFVNYDATDHLVEEVSTELKRLEKDIDSTIESIDLKPFVEPVWGALSAPISLSNYGYLHLFPKRLALDELRFRDQHATLNLHLELQPKIRFDALANKANKLPALSDYQHREGMELYIDIESSYDSLSNLLNKSLKGTTMDISGRTVVFEDVRIHSSQHQRIHIAVTISGNKRGTLYFTGTPVFHALTQEISIPDLTFDVKTRNALLKSAKWLFNDRIEAKLRDATHFDLKPEIDKLRKTVETELNTALQPGVHLSGTIEKLEIEDIYPFSHQLYLRIRMVGKLALRF